ncbi:hypothetical protein B2J89_18585 [Acidovorax sp. SRB_24]|nr:hypothetical protein [Acidovorax sp. SRB_24]
MNSVFVRDFLLEGGISHPVEFAKEYYQKYPAINIGFYPPFLYVSAAPFLAIFGATHAVSQAVIILYALWACVFIYLICRRQLDGVTSLAVTLCIAALPEMLRWSRQVQPDIPAIALLLATAYGLLRHLEGGRSGWLFFMAVCMGLAVLTRTQAIYAAPVCVFFVFFSKYPHRPSFGRRLLALGTAAVIALPAILMAAYFSQLYQSLAVEMPDMPKLWSLQNWLWYAKILPQQMGWAVVALVVAGLIAAVVASQKSGMTPPMRVVAALLCCSWVFFSVVSNKEPRFNLPSLPFLFMLAALGSYGLSARWTARATVLLALFLVCRAVVGHPVPVVAGFKEAVLAAQAVTPQERNVLISAHRDGSFIFDLRTVGHRRDIGSRRADKLFVEMKIVREMGIRNIDMSEKEIVDLLDREKISTVVSQFGYLSDQPTMLRFQKILDAGVFYEKHQTIPMTGETLADETELVVYKRR